MDWLYVYFDGYNYKILTRSGKLKAFIIDLIKHDILNGFI